MNENFPTTLPVSCVHTPQVQGEPLHVPTSLRIKSGQHRKARNVVWHK